MRRKRLRKLRTVQNGAGQRRGLNLLVKSLKKDREIGSDDDDAQNCI